MTSSPACTTAAIAANNASVAPEVTVTSVSGLVLRP